MTRINAYIGFEGKTAEAMNFYKDCLGGELQLIPIEGSPVESEMPEGEKKGILHAALTNGALELMATDCVGPNGYTKGNNISLMLDCSSEDEIRGFYAKLSAGGEATHPVNPAFWGGLFGHLTDKFGIQWLLNCSPEHLV